MHTQPQIAPKMPQMSPYERNIHELDHRYRDEVKVAEIAQKRKNPPDFTQVTGAGWSMIVKINKEAPRALELFSFFAHHLDPSCGAVICDQKFLADRFNVSIRTIQRWVLDLENLGALLRIPVGQTYAYALDPLQVWKGYNTSKDYAVFNTKTLTDRNGEINRKLRIMMSERGMPIAPNQVDLVDDLTE
ncbi:TPA: firmicute plasmid replication protein RepL [Streptococcus suis]